MYRGKELAEEHKETIFSSIIRKEIPSLNLKVNLQATSANSQFKRADKSGSKIALIVGEEELKDNTISIKNLRGKESQETLSLDQVIETLKKL